MNVYTDSQKLLMVLGISVVFGIIVLIIFHFFRKYRKDKLISIE